MKITYGKLSFSINQPRKYKRNRAKRKSINNFLFSHFQQKYKIWFIPSTSELKDAAWNRFLWYECTNYEDFEVNVHRRSTKTPKIVRTYGLVRKTFIASFPRPYHRESASKKSICTREKERATFTKWFGHRTVCSIVRVR